MFSPSMPGASIRPSASPGLDSSTSRCASMETLALTAFARTLGSLAPSACLISFTSDRVRNSASIVFSWLSFSPCLIEL